MKAKTFLLTNEQIIRDWETGQPVENYSGKCLVYSSNWEEPALFVTGFDDSHAFDRYWIAL